MAGGAGIAGRCEPSSGPGGPASRGFCVRAGATGSATRGGGGRDGNSQQERSDSCPGSPTGAHARAVGHNRAERSAGAAAGSRWRPAPGASAVAAASGLRVLTPAGTPARRRGARQACGEGASPAGGTLRAEQTPGRRWTDGRLAAKTVPKTQTRHEENKTVRARRARPLPRAHAVTPSARHARAHWQRTHVCAQPQGRARTHGHAC